MTLEGPNWIPSVPEAMGVFIHSFIQGVGWVLETMVGLVLSASGLAEGSGSERMFQAVARAARGTRQDEHKSRGVVGRGEGGGAGGLWSQFMGRVRETAFSLGDGGEPQGDGHPAQTPSDPSRLVLCSPQLPRASASDTRTSALLRTLSSDTGARLARRRRAPQAWGVGRRLAS